MKKIIVVLMSLILNLGCGLRIRQVKSSYSYQGEEKSFCVEKVVLFDEKGTR